MLSPEECYKKWPHMKYDDLQVSYSFISYCVLGSGYWQEFINIMNSRYQQVLSVMPQAMTFIFNINYIICKSLIRNQIICLITQLYSIQYLFYIQLPVFKKYLPYFAVIKFIVFQLHQSLLCI